MFLNATAHLPHHISTSKCFQPSSKHTGGCTREGWGRHSKLELNRDEELLCVFEPRHNRQTVLLRVNSWAPRSWSFVSAVEHIPLQTVHRHGQRSEWELPEAAYGADRLGRIGRKHQKRTPKLNQRSHNHHQKTPPHDHRPPDRSSHPLSSKIMYLRRQLRSFSSPCIKLEGDTILSPHLPNGHHIETSHPFFASFVKVNST